MKLISNFFMYGIHCEVCNLLMKAQTACKVKCHHMAKWRKSNFRSNNR